MSFKEEVRTWLEENCPASCRGSTEVPGGGTKVPMSDDQRLWLERAADKGYTVPSWPAAYGGAGLSTAQELILLQEMRAMGAPAPVMGMGIMMLGPTLLEYGTDEQKEQHLPKIARGEVWWCQGYSEPGAGSDLASLRTRAEDAGDHFVINGQKIWTTAANKRRLDILPRAHQPGCAQTRRYQLRAFHHGSARGDRETDSAHLRGITLLRDVFRQCNREQIGPGWDAQPGLDGGQKAAATRAFGHARACHWRQPGDGPPNSPTLPVNT